VLEFGIPFMTWQFLPPIFLPWTTDQFSVYKILNWWKNKLFVSAIWFVSLFKFELLITTRIRKNNPFFINYKSNYILLLQGAELLQDRNLSFLWIDNRHQPFGNSAVLLSLGSPPKDTKKLCTVLVLLIIIPIFSRLLLLLGAK
jgi:hypothetical protein